MHFSRHFKIIIIAITSAILFSSCHSKKLIVKNNADKKDVGSELPDLINRGPYIMVKPGKHIAEKYADIMGVKRSDIENGRLYDFIDQWMGVPYRFGGMDKDGIDCSGLVFLLQLQVYDQPVPRTCATQVEVIKRKYEDELKEGDLVFFDYDGKQFSHVGVYLQNGYILHASTRKGVTIVRLHDRGIYEYFSRCGSVINSTASAQSN
ncbi:C40 family peptidase [Mucilaginibacter segetis]|uniref:C40 family peptidase n=1 Tax=Mucilaginibacter segetis TaxID=2793071 RepID=A0A934UM99_9SPHI|nr:C40 family peptidase [Mucilaginibacter segetis]MBK0379179.1 C40 family peptidase [Mucilaginibacter segetis]